MRIHFTLGLLAFFSCLAAISSGQTVSVSYGETRREFTTAELEKLTQVEFESLDHGQPHRYRGIPARDVLSLVGAPLGEKLRGPAIALAVRVRASDGYVAAFGLAEFDSAFREQTIYLVNQQDGAPLKEQAGPWRLVCVGDKKGARSVRQVTSIEVVSLIPVPQP
ncbi:MAG: hypothetical protein QM760_00755 [Nibricoccus sp.]